MINSYFSLLGICCLAIVSPAIQAQAQSITLADAHTMAIANYPMVKQRNLIANSAAYQVGQANADYLPQISINGQATYQSAVTQIPIQVPGVDIPTLSKDQYKLYGEVNQNLYDGGLTRLQKQAIEAETQVEEQALEVELYRIRERINQLFFGVLLLDAQLAQNDLLQQDIKVGLQKTRVAIANGTMLKSHASLLEAELLKADQQAVELQATRKSYVQMLGLFINQPLDENTTLEKPQQQRAEQEINRPELGWYAHQQHRIDVANKLLHAANLPKLGLFLQAGAGRPALNMLSNDFAAYYYGGVRLTIPLSGFYTLKKERALLDIQRKAVDVQRETFLFNTNLSLQQQNTSLAKYQRLLDTDNEIIALRTSVKEASLAQLENGIINTADYMREVLAADNAKLAKILHEIQLLMVQYDINHTTGN